MKFHARNNSKKDRKKRRLSNNKANRNQRGSIETHSKEDHLSSEYTKISSELMKFRYLLNPVRLGVIGLLFKYSYYQQAEIRKILDVSWGQFTSHINSLEKEGYLSKTKQFIDDKIAKILFLTERGRIEFRELRRILKTIVHN